MSAAGRLVQSLLLLHFSSCNMRIRGLLQHLLSHSWRHHCPPAAVGHVRRQFLVWFRLRRIDTVGTSSRLPFSRPLACVPYIFRLLACLPKHPCCAVGVWYHTDRLYLRVAGWQQSFHTELLFGIPAICLIASCGVLCTLRGQQTLLLQLLRAWC